MPPTFSPDAMCRTITVIGITDSRRPELSAEARQAIARARIFSGGLRHHEIIHDFLPEGSEWIDVVVPVTDAIALYREADGPIVVFASADPLFFGFAATIIREMPEATVRVIGAPSSLQLLAWRVALPYQDMRAVSLTGRPWVGLDNALIADEAKIGVLTDRRHTPAAIASRMLDYGYDNYEMIIGERLGNELDERITRCSLAEAAGREWSMPNCLFLIQLRPRLIPFGIPDSEFASLDGRPGMITKMPYRLLALSMLSLPGRKSLWDIGFCTGSVSVEARRQFPTLAVTAFERRPESRELLEVNARRFGAPGIEGVITDFMTVDLEAFPRPDAVFIGGHGGRLAEMLERITRYLLPGGTVVFNSVSAESAEAFRVGAAAARLVIESSHHVALDSFNPVTIFKATLPHS